MAKRSLVLNSTNVKEGVKVRDGKEVAYRKLNLDVFNEVRFARKAVVVTNYGRKLAVIVPLPEEETA